MKQVDKALISLLGKDGTGLNDGVIHRMLLKLDDWEAKIMTRVYTTDGKNIQLFIKPM